MIEWISVKDNLPKENTIVLVKDIKGNWGPASYIYLQEQSRWVWCPPSGECCPRDEGFFDIEDRVGGKIRDIEVSHWVYVK